MKKDKKLELATILLGICVGSVIGLISMFCFFVYDFDNIRTNNGFIYKEDCLSSSNFNETNYSNFNETNYLNFGRIEISGSDCIKVLCSSNCFVELSDCYYYKVKYNDSWIKDLVDRKILTKEYCEKC